MSPAGKRIFVSYSHKDHEDSTVAGKIFTHLYGLNTVYGVPVAEQAGPITARDAQMRGWPTNAVEWRQPAS